MNFWHLTAIKHKVSFLTAGILSLLLGCNVSAAGMKKPVFIKDKRLPEISGIAASNYYNDIFWVINDGRNPAEIYAVNSKGKVVSELAVKGAKNRDWEDLASFKIGNKGYIAIGDIGDNRATRSISAIYIIKEPRNLKRKGKLKIEKEIYFSFEGGALDCESMAISIAEKRIYLVSKRTNPAMLFSLPLDLQSDKTHVAAKVGDLALGENRIKSYWTGSLFFPTAMDINRSETAMAIMSYDKVVVYRKKKGESWHKAIKKPLIIDDYPLLKQAEAIAFVADDLLLITSEKLPAPMLFIDFVE
ncbi:MAG: hypothetical protein D6B27_12895 [Gammaproteobacteria bacterium]|nr:MAG: hypothetical protein D6B27_12895 [Gammaproteobacteria bacterium]